MDGKVLSVRVFVGAAEYDAMRKDAERYRWMRDCENGSGPSGGSPYDDADGGWERVDWLYDDKLDEAIDAAMVAARCIGDA